MNRDFGNVELGNKLPDDVSAVGQTILWAGLPSGRDKAFH